ncbi:MAG: hemerythrin domain-containing protein [Polyangiales bacterium]
MTRESPYATSHKGLRHAIARFQLLAGRTRYDRPDDVALLRERGDELALLLTHHLEAEERFFLTPLRARHPAAAEHDLHEHEQLEQVQAAWVDALARLDGSPEQGRHFYLQVTDFHARYLAHILHEERVTESAMFACFTNDEVAEFSSGILASVELPVLVASLRYIVPAQSDDESRALLERLRPAPFFGDVVAALREDLGDEALARLL